MMKASFSAMVLKWPSNPLTCITDTVHDRLVLMNLWNCSFQSCSKLCSCLSPHPFLYLSPGAASVSLIHTIQWMFFQHFGTGGFTYLRSHSCFKTLGILKKALCQWDKNMLGSSFVMPKPLSPFFPVFLSALCISSWTVRFQGKKFLLGVYLESARLGLCPSRCLWQRVPRCLGGFWGM